MKKTIALLLAVLMLAALCACGSGNGGNDNSGTPGTSSDVPENLDELVAESMLSDIFTEMSISLHDGDAGSSLTASAFAGRILDLYAAGNLTKSGITSTTETFCASLNEERAAEFPGQLGLVYDAAVILCGETGSSALEDSGYEAESYPWNADDTEDIFSAIYDGAQLDKPE